MADYNINTFARHVVTEQQDLHPAASGSFSWLLNGIELACKIIGEEVRRLGLSSAAGYQILERATRPEPFFRGPSPLIVFGVDLVLVADFGGGSFAATGRIETGGHAPRGTLSLDFEAKKIAAIATMIENFAPKGAGPVVSLLNRVGHAKLHATLDISGEDKAATVAQLALAGDVDNMRVDTRVHARGDWTKPSAGDVRIDATIDALDGASLIKLMSLDRVVAADAVGSPRCAHESRPRRMA
jgi:hypothetical protein